MNGRLEAEQMAAQHEAANTWLQEEIKRLRLTDAEREAIQHFIDGGPDDVVSDPPHLAVLERLLERTKGDTNAV
jgi:hypothetical protein